MFLNYILQGYGEASFYAVYDGHNGLDAAVYSSMYLHQYLVQSSHYLTDPKYALFEAFYATDRGFTQKTENYVSLFYLKLYKLLNLFYLLFFRIW